MKQQKNALSQVHSEPAKKPLEKFRMICIKIGKRNLIIACSVLMIGVAVLLNFVLFTGTNHTSPELGNIFHAESCGKAQ